MLKKMMELFAKELGIEEGLGTEIPGVYLIPIDEGLNVFVTELPGGFSMKCSVVDCPKMDVGSYYTYIMGANLLGKETHGNVLGLNEDGEVLTLSRHVDYEVNYKEFSYLLEDFFNQVEFWREETLAFGKK